MKVLIFFVSLTVVVLGSKERIEKCVKIDKEFNQCATKAHETYKTASEAGSDGRPDFAARKACNYLTDAVETCGDKLLEDEECYSEKEVLELKDRQIETVLSKLQISIKTWESDKCPPVKAHMDRLKAAAEAEDAGGAASHTTLSGLLLGFILGLRVLF